MTKKIFIVEGMSCSACSASVERAVGRVEGVESASVNLLGKTMLCTFDEDKTNAEDIIRAVTKAGFEARLEKEEKREEKAEKSEEEQVKKRLAVSFAFLLVLMYISMGHMLHLPELPFFKGTAGALPLAFTQLLLTIPVLFINKKFFVSGAKALKNKAPNMDTLVAIGSLSGVVYGIFVIYMLGYGLGVGDTALVESYRHNLYFESSAMILTLVTLGKFFESRAERKTGDALGALEELCPETVEVERNGLVVTVPSEKVSVGDVVLLRPGSRAAFDGVITEGEGSFDLSALTGESMPVLKKTGDGIISGSLMIDSSVKFRVTSVGEDTTLSRIISLVQSAVSTKAPLAKLADKVSRIFVPVVISLSLLTLLLWTLLGESFDFALSRALSVLVISCPCALGLATPVAITVSVGRLAGEGILVKNASWAELTSGVKTVAFDKTGTITTGKMQVSDVESDNKEALMSVALSLEKYSSHPLARAIVEYCGEKNAHDITDFTSVSGRGVSGRIDGYSALGGNLDFMEENGIDVGRYKDTADALSNDGKTVMYFALEKEVLGIIAIRDGIREDAKNMISALRHRGIRTVLLTGDNERVASVVAKEVGVDEFVAGMLPDGKTRKIKELQKRGLVAMVGDGVNDSPSLATADIGISMGNGTDIAIDSSDVVLMGSEISKVERLVDYAGSTLRIMKQNLFWAFIYNVLGIPLAAGVLYVPFGILLNPMIAAAAMSCSSLFVVTNALRLLKK